MRHVVVALCLFVSCAAWADLSWQDRWIAAENLKEKSARYEALHTLAENVPKELPKGFMQHHIDATLLDAGLASRDMPPQVFALTPVFHGWWHMLKGHLLLEHDARLAFEHLKKAEAHFIQGNRKHLMRFGFHGLADSIAQTQHGKDVFPLDKDHYLARWLQYISYGWHRADVLENVKRPQGGFTQMLYDASIIKGASVRRKALLALFESQLDAKHYYRAVRVAHRLEDGVHRAHAFSKLARTFKKTGRTQQAAQAWSLATDAVADERKPQRAAEAAQLLKKARSAYDEIETTTQNPALPDSVVRSSHNHKIRDAVKSVIASTALAQQRAQWLRTIANNYAATLDMYGWLTGTYERPQEHEDIPQWQQTTLNEHDVSIATMPESELGYRLPKDDRKEVRALTKETLLSRLPLPFEGLVHRLHVGQNEYMNPVFRDAALAQLERHDEVPDMMYISSGIISLGDIADWAKGNGVGHMVHRDANALTLRRPLVIGENATLIIDCVETPNVQLSVEGAASLVNAGTLYITCASITGWDEKSDAAALRSYDQRGDFRPFIAAWSRSHTYISGTHMRALGYDNHKSYGLSLSAGPDAMLRYSSADVPRPTGAIVDNYFENIYYGFYSYEADDVALIGNTYDANIVYGIDPHDRSQRLTIAYNTAFDTEKKHGIIISREVNDTQMIGNISINNAGSGFMIDRQSTGTFFYANTAIGNAQDGLSLFESHCTITAANRMENNASAGVRLRNGKHTGLYRNLLQYNDGAGIIAYAHELRKDSAHRLRDFAMDPYEKDVRFHAVGNIIRGNDVGLQTKEVHAFSLRGNHFRNQSPHVIKSDWLNNAPAITTRYDMNEGMWVGKQCATDAETNHHACPFTEKGIFNGSHPDTEGVCAP